jgi:tRNA threonylcarbamoyladenosine dehydratase
MVAFVTPHYYNNKKDIPRGARIVDTFERSLRELFFIEHPRVQGKDIDRKSFNAYIKEHAFDDMWVYYPWRHTAVRLLSEGLFFRLRTARNRNLITVAEQHRYRETCVGVAGLSVGSAILASLVMSGGPKTLKIADFDVIEVSNLNRIRATLLDVGENKAEVAARGVWELDPFTEVKVFRSGLTATNLEKFITGKPRLSVFVDEMDSIDLKVMSRRVCKKHGIPVIMATDNGDSVILDIERFDLERKRPIFHGLMDEYSFSDLTAIDRSTWLRIATTIIDPKLMTERLQDSMLLVGKELGGPPQLGTTAAMAGAAVSFTIRLIANNVTLRSGRYIVSLEEKMLLNYMGKRARQVRDRKTKKFISNLFNEEKK